MPKHLPDDDDHVTDLARYRKAREQAARKKARSRPPSESFLGSNPRAGLILLILVVVLLALSLGPRFF